MKRNIFLIVLFFSISVYCFSQKAESEKAIMRIPKYGKTLKKALRNPTKAKYVFVSNYSDSIFPNDHILKLINIEQIVVYGRLMRKNKMDSLTNPISLRIDTTKIKQLSKLKYLQFAYFDMRNFPVELCYLRDLKGLSLGICLIDSLPNEIQNLKNLEILEARINNIKVIPSNITNLNNLLVLDLSNNLFTNLPMEINQCQSLYKINLTNSEGRREERISWAWPLILPMNKINCSSEFDKLKTMLLNPKIKKLYLMLENKEEKLNIKARLNSKELYQKLSIGIGQIN